MKILTNNYWELTTNKKKIDILDFLSKAEAEKIEGIYIGTDSHYRHGKHTFITALVIQTKNPPAYVCLKRSISFKEPTLYEKLFNETYLSIDNALELNGLLNSDITIHLDVNSNKKYASYKYKSQLEGYVKSFGFNYEIKPNSWCATCVADKFSK